MVQMWLLTTPETLLEVCKSLGNGVTVFHIEKNSPLPEECISLHSFEGDVLRACCGFFPRTMKLARRKFRKAAVGHHLQMLNDSELTTT